MSTADQILDQINSALDDLAVSGDAMRSRPAGTPTAGNGVAALTPEQAEEVARAIRAVADTYRAVADMHRRLCEAMAPAMREACRTLARAVETARHARQDEYTPAPPHPRRTDGRPAWQSPYGPARRR